MSDVILKIENLSKQYRLGTVGTGTLSHDLNRWWHQIRGKEDPYLKVGESNDRSTKGESEYVWALRDINLEVRKGEVLGIIGKNGAGKSTLLKILSKVTGPTIGSIKSKGRIASLLEVGTGFHPELTGKENIFLNGAILGMTKTEINSKYDEIVEFSGCERYIDTPVKRYSSGMRVRLAFAVAAFLEPDILVVDEVLAVGDAEFQKKAIGKMQDISRGDGRTVLFVSHNMAAVRNLCSRGIVLENGRIGFEGDISSSIDFYLRDVKNENKFEYKGKKIIKKALLKNGDLQYLSTFELSVFFELSEPIKNIMLGIVIKDMHNVELIGINNGHYFLDRIKKDKISKGEILVTINKLKLLPGKYTIDLFLGDKNVDYEKINNAISFEIKDTYNFNVRRKLNYKINKVFQDQVNFKLLNHIE